MNFDTFLNSISKLEQMGLPGESSQIKMSPPYRLELMEMQKEAMKSSKKAGVMALFYPNNTYETNLILILRKSYKGVHSAQIGFPGGKVELADLSLKETAIRETFEEIGVPMQEMTVVKQLTHLYIPPSNFTVFPFIGYTSKTPMFIKQDDEVEDLIEVTFSYFMDDSIVTTKRIMTSYNVEVEVPAFNIHGHIVWGATAMMLSEIKDLLKTII